MIVEDMLIMYWINSGDQNFLSKHQIDDSYFTVRSDIVKFMQEFSMKYNKPPTLSTVQEHFSFFSPPQDLDPIEYVVGKIKENKMMIEVRSVIIEAATQIDSGKTSSALVDLKYKIESILDSYQDDVYIHDWVKDALKRYDTYLENAEQKRTSLMSTGLKRLDEVVGGWREDDLVLIAGRTNEGKSYVGIYLAYLAWMQLKQMNRDNPVIYISTEMPEIEIAWRMDTIRSHLSNRALVEGRLSAPEAYLEYLEQLAVEKQSFIIMTNDANGGRRFTPQDIHGVIETHKPALLVIDQLYDLSDGTNERDIRRQIVKVVNAIRDIGLYSKTPIFLIAQAGREAVKDSKKVADMTPELHHIQESDTPAQKATKVLTIRKINDIIKLTVRKNRGGERDKDIVLRVDLDTGIWEEIQEFESIF